MPNNTSSVSALNLKEDNFVKIDSTITVGNYWQESSEKKSPIEWIVLKKKGKKALLVSKLALNCKQYHHYYLPVNWEKCDLRKWLNTEFLTDAFSDEEQARIPITHLINEDNKKCGTRGGNATEDRIFCLSISEAQSFFKDDDSRKCLPTAYAIENNAWYSDENGCCDYWLRSPGYYRYFASYVKRDGALDLHGLSVSYFYFSVRPALWLNL